MSHTRQKNGFCDTLPDQHCVADNTPSVARAASVDSDLALSVQEEGGVDTESEAGSVDMFAREATVSVMECAHSDAVAVDNNESETEDLYLEQLAFEAGYNVEDITSHVGSITNRKQQKLLKNPQRNKAFKKSVVDRRDGKDILICMSDDIVLHCNCATRQRGWFIKSRGQRMSPGEQDFYNCLQRSNQVTDPHYEDFFRVLERDLDVATNLIRLLLG